jgi:hypothetical protein
MSQTESVPDGVTAPDLEVIDKLIDYDEHRDPTMLKQAADAAALHDRQASAPDLALRLARQRVAGWLAILERLKRDEDPTFDLAHPPPRRVEPPLLSNGIQLPPGVDPEEIKDPAARRAYVDAIARNEERRAAFNRNAALARAHTSIMERAPASVADAHETLGLAVNEIVAAANAADIAPADRDALLAGLR